MTELVYINGELFHADDLSNDALAHYGGNVRLVEPMALPAARKAIGR